jgi:hypothetical protein
MLRHHQLFFTVAALSGAVAFGLNCGGNGGTGTTTSHPSGSSGAGAGGSSTSGPGGGGAGGDASSSSSTGTGGSTADYVDCPTAKFPAAKQFTFGTGGDTHTLDADATWTKDNLYVVIGHLTIEGTKSPTLKIQAGTTVCFAVDTGTDEAGAIDLAPTAPGGLDVQGTAAEPVVLTSAGGADDWWSRITGGPNYTIFSLAHVDFYNPSIGGGDGPGAVQTLAGGTVPPVVLDHVSFHQLNAGLALDLQNGVGLSASSSVTVPGFVKNSSTMQYEVIRADPVSAASLLPGMLTVDTTKVPADLRVIRLSEYNLNDTVTWQDTGLPFYSDSDFTIKQLTGASPILTLDAGVTWKFAPGVSLFVGGSGGFDTGDLIVKGSAAKPVVFTAYGATSDPANYWGGIWFESTGPGYGFDATVSKIDHARLEYGGASFEGEINCHDPDPSLSSTKEPAELMIDGIHDYDGPAITNTQFSHSAGDAVRAYCTTTDCLVSPDYTAAAGNTFDNIKAAQQLTPLSTCP